MLTIPQALSHWQRQKPNAIAIADSRQRLDWNELARRVRSLSSALLSHRCRSVALLADNGCDWIVADLAALTAGVTLVPVPAFFSDEQVAHVLAAARVDTILTDDLAHRVLETSANSATSVSPGGLYRVDVAINDAAPPTLPDGTAKVTFTSGSTGRPRGVCLSGEGLQQTAAALAATLSTSGIRRHLCSLPLATLLENVAGVYTPLLLGATVRAPSLSEVGLSGSSGIDAGMLRRAIEATAAESLILLPGTLQPLAAELLARPLQRNSLRFAAVGGARVSVCALEEAGLAGIPVFQGYGLSECHSVVALNRPGANRPGSVGRPVPGVGIRCAGDGEILVTGPTMAGYLDGPRSASAEFATGDLGRIDEDGYLYVEGRKKSVFITAFGRNVNPEWPEAELLQQPEIAQAVVFGEARPCNTAVIVPAVAAGGASLGAAVRRANGRLPDYARVAEWIIADEPFSPANGLLTPSGKPCRDAVALRYPPADPGMTALNFPYSKENRYDLL